MKLHFSCSWSKISAVQTPRKKLSSCRKFQLHGGNKTPRDMMQSPQQNCLEMAHLPCTQCHRVDPSSPTHILTLYILSLCGFIGE